MEFVSLRLSQPLLQAVTAAGYTLATPIQAQAIPPILEGKDLLGCAQTGTGKTAAFALPILDRLAATPPARPRKTRALVLCPTRELALQIVDSFRTYGKHQSLQTAAVFGGVGQGPQVTALRGGADIIVATPGRLLDLMEQGHADLRHVEVLVLDEADRMLDMGFIHDLRRIVASVPAQRQTLLFSATMPADIRHLAASFLKDPVHVHVAPASATADRVTQSVYHVERGQKPALLAHLAEELGMHRAIVFTRTKHGADRVVRQLYQRGIQSEAIHGDKTQGRRQRALESFRNGRTRILVATDIASRGIDVDDVTHVVNFDIPHEPEAYVHRIGRTARAGASGVAVSFVSSEEVGLMRAIERLTRQQIPVVQAPAEVKLSVATPERERAVHPLAASGPLAIEPPRPPRRFVPKPTGASGQGRHRGQPAAGAPASAGGFRGFGHAGNRDHQAAMQRKRGRNAR